MSETIVVPDNGSNNGWNSPLGMLALGNGGGFGGFGNNTIGDLIGLAIVASIFGWGGNGFGGFGNNNGNGAAGFLSNQINNDAGRELIMQAVNSNGEASRAAIQNLATMLGQDYSSVSNSLQNVMNVLSNIGAQQGMNALQVINAIQSGNSTLPSALQNCCCENRLLTTQQGYEAQIRTLEQTNQLGSQADRNANDIIKAINAQTVEMDNQFCAARERDMQSKIDTQSDIITQLRNQIDNANQTAAITGYVNSLIAPLQAKVTQIADKQVNTIPVPWPNLTAVNTTPYMGGFYGNGWFGNGWNNGITF